MQPAQCQQQKKNNTYSQKNSEACQSFFHKWMSAGVWWQMILAHNETVGCTETMTSLRLCPLPLISANPQSQTWLFFLMTSLLFVSWVIFFNFWKLNSEKHYNVHFMFCQFLKVPRGIVWWKLMQSSRLLLIWHN